jgi:hypothetical protein
VSADPSAAAGDASAEAPAAEGHAGEVLAAEVLAARLLAAHARVRNLPAGERGAATRRLLALSDASKHDVARAALRLDRLLADLDAGQGASAREA